MQLWVVPGTPDLAKSFEKEKTIELSFFFPAFTGCESVSSLEWKENNIRGVWREISASLFTKSSSFGDDLQRLMEWFVILLHGE